MAHRGRALAIAVGTGLGAADAYDHLPASRQPHLHLGGVDELLALVTELSLSLLRLESCHERHTCLRIH